MWTQIAENISLVTGKVFIIENIVSVTGGCVNQAYAIKGKGSTYFVKINRASQAEMFAAEALGLKQIYSTQTIKVPQVICWGIADDSSYFVLEWLEFAHNVVSKSWEDMGRKLANLHKINSSDRFGWHRHNTIGLTPQINTWTSNWADFFAEHRIGYQLELAQKKCVNFPNYEEIKAAIRSILADLKPQPSLVHGDLWSGNVGITTLGEPVILDPATYYGHREVDLAMTELFGGFPAAFYRGYHQTWPLDRGYSERKNIYNLYHILNHFNLFGGNYIHQAERMIREILNYAVV
jgi:fructosamine-3-kinase